jgi:chromosome segregation ATPase
MRQKWNEYQDQDKVIKELIEERQQKKNEISRAIAKINSDIQNFTVSHKSKIDNLIKPVEKKVLTHKYNLQNLTTNIKKYTIIDEGEKIDTGALKNSMSDETIKKENLLKNIQDLKNILKGYNPNALEEAQNNLNKIQIKINCYNEAVIANNEILVLNQKAAEAVENSKVEIERLKNEDIKINAVLATYKEAKIVLSKTLPNYMVIKTCAKLEQEINDFMLCCFPNFYVKLFFNKKGVEFYFTEDRNNLKPKAETEIEKEDLITIKLASGFQKALLSTAFKIALCRAYQLPLLVLDESDATSTDENSENMFNTILNSDFFEQTIIITHKKIIRDLILSEVSDYRAYQVKKYKFLENANGDY